MEIKARRKTEVYLNAMEKEILVEAATILDRILLYSDRYEEYVKVGKDSWHFNIVEEMKDHLKEIVQPEKLELETPDEAE